MTIAVTGAGGSASYNNACSVPLRSEREPERGPVVRMQQVLDNCDNLKTRLDNIESTAHTYTVAQTFSNNAIFNGNLQTNGAALLNGATNQIGDSSGDACAVYATTTFYTTPSLPYGATFNGIMTATGAGRVRETVQFCPDADQVISTYTSFIYFLSITAARTCKINFSGSAQGDSVEIRLKNGGSWNLYVTNSADVNIMTINQSTFFMGVRLVWNGANWEWFGIKA